MPVLHLGVIDLPYSNAVAKKGKTPNATTGDVAEILEEKYHPMEHYYELHEQEIADHLGNAAAGALETAAMGGPIPDNMYDAAMGDIEAGFKKMLTEGELEKLGYPGVPTQAALDGVNHRFKHPYAKRKARPSFIDTGLYQSSFKAWVD